MARNSVRLIGSAGLSGVPVYTWQRDDRDTSSEVAGRAGELYKTSGAGAAFAVRLLDADLTIGTDQPFLGLGAKDATETATADGVVEMYIPLPGLLYEIIALTATAADTRAEIDTMRGDYQVIDVASTAVDAAITLDTAIGSGANNAFLVIDGDPSRSALWVMVRADGTAIGRGSA